MKKVNAWDFSSLISIAKANSCMIAVVILYTLGGFMFGGVFLSYSNNFINVFRQMSMMGIVSVGVNFVLITGGRDLSVGACTAVCSMVIASLSRYGIWVCVIASILVGTLVGLSNGLVITKLRVQPFIATLGMQTGMRGLALVFNNELAIPIHENAKGIITFVKSNLFGIIPTPFVVFLAIVILGIIVSKYTGFGRAIYAIGGNEESAKMMGIQTDRVKMFVYMICGTLCGVSAIIYSGRMSSGQPIAGVGWEMNIMAAAVIGGTRVTGGAGRIIGSFFGVLFIALIGNMINMQGTLSTYWQDIITGMVLLIVVLIQSQSEKRNAPRVISA